MWEKYTRPQKVSKGFVESVQKLSSKRSETLVYARHHLLQPKSLDNLGYGCSFISHHRFLSLPNYLSPCKRKTESSQKERRRRDNITIFEPVPTCRRGWDWWSQEIPCQHQDDLGWGEWWALPRWGNWQRYLQPDDWERSGMRKHKQKKKRTNQKCIMKRGKQFFHMFDQCRFQLHSKVRNSSLCKNIISNKAKHSLFFSICLLFLS